MTVLRRIRGLVGIAVLWGIAISAIGTAFIVGGLAAGWIPPIPGVGWTRWIVVAADVALRDFVGGSVSGAVFATLLAGAERRRNVDTLSLSRVAVWGFLAAAVPTALAAIVIGPVIPPAVFVAGTVATGVLGVGLGVGMVRLARRASGAAAADAAVQTG